MKIRSLSSLVVSGSLFFLAVANEVSAQLYTSSRSFTVVATNSASVQTTDDSGVAVQALFEFDQTLGYLRLTLTNLSGTLGYTDGIVQGFGFDGPSGLTYVAGSFTTESVSAGEPGGVNYTLGLGYNFSGLGADGTFDFGAGTAGANGNGGGSPSDGLAGGFTAAFRFQFAGDLTNFDATDFFANNGTDADFGLRFQGVAVVNSEKLVDFVSDEAPPIPEPSTYGLIGAGMLLAGVGLKRWRAKRSAADLR